MLAHRSAWLSLVLAKLIWIASVGVAQAGEDPAQWLVRMTDSARSTNYSGMVVYRSGEMMETMRLIHRFQDGEVRERIFSMTGEQREILRKDDEVTCIIPREKKVTIDRLGGKGLFPQLPKGTVQELKRNYEFQDMGVTRVAGRDCQGIRIQPKDSYRYGYQIWLDRDTAVPVKMTLVDHDGKMLEQVLFTQIDFPERIDDQQLLPELDHKGYELFTHSLTPIETGGQSQWGFDALPSGFAVAMRDVRMLPEGEGSIEHLLLSDGLSSVSVYSTRLKPDDHGHTGLLKMGAVHTYARELGGHQITVVGEVPAVTVEMIGEALHSDANETTDD